MFWSLVRQIADDFHSWQIIYALQHSWPKFAKFMLSHTVLYTSYTESSYPSCYTIMDEKWVLELKFPFLCQGLYNYVSSLWYIMRDSHRNTLGFLKRHLLHSYKKIGKVVDDNNHSTFQMVLLKKSPLDPPNHVLIHDHVYFHCSVHCRLLPWSSMAGKWIDWLSHIMPFHYAHYMGIFCFMMHHTHLSYPHIISSQQMICIPLLPAQIIIIFGHYWVPKKFSKISLCLLKKCCLISKIKFKLFNEENVWNQV